MVILWVEPLFGYCWAMLQFEILKSQKEVSIRAPRPYNGPVCLVKWTHTTGWMRISISRIWIWASLSLQAYDEKGTVVQGPMEIIYGGRLKGADHDGIEKRCSPIG